MVDQELEFSQDLVCHFRSAIFRAPLAVTRECYKGRRCSETMGR